MNLKNKNALVTASAKRIGRQIAIDLARAGCNVVVHYNTSEADAICVVDEIRKLGVQAWAVRADLRDVSQIENMFAQIKKRFNKLDVLVNNASIYYPTPLEELSADQLSEMFSVNAAAAELCTKHAVALMQDEGTIINIIDAKLDRANYPAYCASKSALIGITKSNAIALAEKNIRVNAVCPGVILWNDQTPQKTRDKIISQIPMKHPGQPEDISNAVIFLASQNYITGQLLNVDGGWNM